MAWTIRSNRREEPPLQRGPLRKAACIKAFAALLLSQTHKRTWHRPPVLKALLAARTLKQLWCMPKRPGKPEAKGAIWQSITPWKELRFNTTCRLALGTHEPDSISLITLCFSSATTHRHTNNLWVQNLLCTLPARSGAYCNCSGMLTHNKTFGRACLQIVCSCVCRQQHMHMLQDTMHTRWLSALGNDSTSPCG